MLNGDPKCGRSRYQKRRQGGNGNAVEICHHGSSIGAAISDKVL